MGLMGTKGLPRRGVPNGGYLGVVTWFLMVVTCGYLRVVTNANNSWLLMVTNWATNGRESPWVYGVTSGY